MARQEIKPIYKYSRMAPKTNVTYMGILYVPGHSMGLIRRRNIMQTKGKISKQVFCTCKWRSDKWVSTKRQIDMIFNLHCIEVSKQASLFDVEL